MRFPRERKGRGQVVRVGEHTSAERSHERWLFRRLMKSVSRICDSFASERCSIACSAVAHAEAAGGSACHVWTHAGTAIIPIIPIIPSPPPPPPLLPPSSPCRAPHLLHLRHLRREELAPIVHDAAYHCQPCQPYANHAQPLAGIVARAAGCRCRCGRRRHGL